MAELDTKTESLREFVLENEALKNELETIKSAA